MPIQIRLLKILNQIHSLSDVVVVVVVGEPDNNILPVDQGERKCKTGVWEKEIQ